MIRFLLDNPHGIRSIQLQESSTERSRNDSWSIILDSGETISDKYAVRAMVFKFLRDIEKELGELGYKVWLSRKKYNILKPEYDLESVAKYLDLELPKYISLYRQVDDWVEKEGVERNLIRSYDS